MSIMETFLMDAIVDENSELVKTYLDNNYIPCDAISKAIYLAANLGNVAIINLFHERNHFQESHTKKTFLNAVYRNHFPLVTRLLEILTLPPETKTEAVSIAVNLNYLDMLKIFYSKETASTNNIFDPPTKDHLLAAIQNDNLDIIAFFYSQGFDFSFELIDEIVKSPKMLQYFLPVFFTQDNNGNLVLKDEAYRLSLEEDLFRAAINKNEQLVQIYLEHGITLDGPQFLPLDAYHLDPNIVFLLENPQCTTTMTKPCRV